MHACVLIPAHVTQHQADYFSAALTSVLYLLQCCTYFSAVLTSLLYYFSAVLTSMLYYFSAVLTSMLYYFSAVLTCVLPAAEARHQAVHAADRR